MKKSRKTIPVSLPQSKNSSIAHFLESVKNGLRFSFNRKILFPVISLYFLLSLLVSIFLAIFSSTIYSNLSSLFRVPINSLPNSLFLFALMFAVVIALFLIVLLVCSNWIQTFIISVTYCLFENPTNETEAIKQGIDLTKKRFASYLITQIVSYVLISLVLIFSFILFSLLFLSFVWLLLGILFLFIFLISTMFFGILSVTNQTDIYQSLTTSYNLFLKNPTGFILTSLFFFPVKILVFIISSIPAFASLISLFFAVYYANSSSFITSIIFSFLLILSLLWFSIFIGWLQLFYFSTLNSLRKSLRN